MARFSTYASGVGLLSFGIFDIKGVEIPVTCSFSTIASCRRVMLLIRVNLHIVFVVVVVAVLVVEVVVVVVVVVVFLCRRLRCCHCCN